MHICAFLQLDIDYGREILRGIGEFCRGRPDIRISWHMKPRSYQPRLIRKLKPDGIIAKISSPDEERELLKLGSVPIVNVSGQLSDPRVPTVNTDDLVVGRMGFQHLSGRGYRQLAYVGSSAHAASRLRLQGFVQAAEGAGIHQIASYNISRGELDRPSLEKSIVGLAAWVASLPKPVGVFTFTDRLALQVEAACRNSHLRVPEDVAILGVGNDQIRLVFPSVELSSIHLNARRIGALAVESLVEYIDLGRPIPKMVLIGPAKIQARRSTDRLMVSDEVVAQALDYIQEHLAEPTYVDEIARAVGVSRRSLEVRFLRSLGASVYAEVQRQHFEHAMLLMSNPANNITEAAYGAGFSSAQTFSTMFRRRFGTSPSDYRDKLLGMAGSTSG